jgi:hypothetical protein
MQVECGAGFDPKVEAELVSGHEPTPFLTVAEGRPAAKRQPVEIQTINTII